MENFDFLVSDCSSLYNWISKLESDMLEDLIGRPDPQTKDLLVENGCEIIANTDNIESVPLTKDIEERIYQIMLKEIEIEYLVRKRVIIDHFTSQSRNLTLSVAIGRSKLTYDVFISDLQRLDRIKQEVSLSYF